LAVEAARAWESKAIPRRARSRTEDDSFTAGFGRTPALPTVGSAHSRATPVTREKRCVPFAFCFSARTIWCTMHVDRSSRRTVKVSGYGS